MIVPDYAIPDALIVPHYDSSIRDTLEAIARAAVGEVGVVLLSGDPNMTRRFVDSSDYPDRFSIVSAPYDSPWVRDRSPFAMKNDDDCQWVVPAAHMPERENDAKLFQSIARHPLERIDLCLPQGNLVAGANGMALSTTRVLMDNDLTSETDLRPFMEPLGLETWFLLESFKTDTISHIDCYARFTKPDQLFLAWDQNDSDYCSMLTRLEKQIKEIFPALEIVHMPVSMSGEMFNSPLNWIQLNDLILIPAFPETTPEEKSETTQLLQKHLFRVRYIASPTTEFGGALHCLTASVYI